MERDPGKVVSERQINSRISDGCYSRLGALAYADDTHLSSIASDFLENASSLPPDEPETNNVKRIKQVNARVSADTFERLSNMALSSKKSLHGVTSRIIEESINAIAEEDPAIDELVHLQAARKAQKTR